MPDYWTENRIERPSEHIVCAANRFPDGLIICGARHWDNLMCRQADALGVKAGQEEQGFVNQFGEFRTRRQALLIVQATGQKFDQGRNGASDELYSEGIY